MSFPPLIPHRRENVQHICKSCSFVYTMYLLLRQCLGRGFEFSVAEDDLGFLIFLVRHRSASDGAWNMVPGTEARAVCVLSRSTSPHHDVSRSSHMIAGRTAFPKGFFFLLVSRSLAPSFPDWDWTFLPNLVSPPCCISSYTSCIVWTVSVEL